MYHFFAFDDAVIFESTQTGEKSHYRQLVLKPSEAARTGGIGFFFFFQNKCLLSTMKKTPQKTEILNPSHGPGIEASSVEPEAAVVLLWLLYRSGQ